MKMIGHKLQLVAFTVLMSELTYSSPVPQAALYSSSITADLQRGEEELTLLSLLHCIVTDGTSNLTMTYI